MIANRKEQNLTLENFEGPLDLLLHLIRKKQMNILEVSLIEIADQYVDFINNQSEINLDEASDYLLLASQLIDIKTKSLLKGEVFIEKDSFDQEKENLLERLIEYEKYKLLAESLKDIYDGAYGFEKISDDFVPYLESESEILIRLVSEGKFDIQRALRNIVFTLRNSKGRETTLRVKRKSAEQIRSEIIGFIESGDTTFLTILKDNSNYYIALALLVILEMSKNGEITIKQNSDYSDIEIRRT